MRFAALASLAGALVVMTVSAQATWRGYISHPLGFAFAAPGELQMEKGTYRGEVAGPRQTTVYKFVQDGIEYRASQIIVSAHRINQGITPDLRKPGGESDFYFVPAEDPETAIARIIELVRTRVQDRFHLELELAISVW